MFLSPLYRYGNRGHQGPTPGHFPSLIPFSPVPAAWETQPITCLKVQSLEPDAQFKSYPLLLCNLGCFPARKTGSRWSVRHRVTMAIVQVNTGTLAPTTVGVCEVLCGKVFHCLLLAATLNGFPARSSSPHPRPHPFHSQRDESQRPGVWRPG